MSTITVKTYAELETFFKAFKAGKINLLVVQSSGGLSKTHTAERLLPDALFIRGHATPLSMYLTIHREDPDLICFDDVETLLENHRNTTMLKQLCDSKEIKIIEYHTTKQVKNEDVPNQIKTKAKTLILCNNLERRGQDIKALMSRAIHIIFTPSVPEILGKLYTFAKDTEILREIEKIAHIASGLNLRLYTKTLELKLSGMSWRRYLYAMALQDTQIVIYKQIEAEESNLSVKDRAMLFAQLTGKSVRQYHIIKKKVQKCGVESRMREVEE